MKQVVEVVVYIGYYQLINSTVTHGQFFQLRNNK